jgi:uroporphyrinogen decarboxylase
MRSIWGPFDRRSAEKGESRASEWFIQYIPVIETRAKQPVLTVPAGTVHSFLAASDTTRRSRDNFGKTINPRFARRPTTTSLQDSFMNEEEGDRLMAGKPAPILPKPLLRVLAGEILARPPWWLMRQAGRYLPEYRAIRATAGDFVTLCLTPELAAEVTLQPVRRFGMDAAILFSDILLVPRALGQRLSFENEGPRLQPVADIARLGGCDMAMLAPVGEAVRRVRGALPEQTALIGFAGAPWTVATYMIEGGTSRDFHRVKSLAYADPLRFDALIETITAATLDFLMLQAEAGVEVLQLFDSWAGALAPAGFERWVVAPTRRLVASLKQRFPHVPIIGFPRGAGFLYPHYAAETGVDAVSLDTSVPPAAARNNLQPQVAVQGNLDPVLLTVGGEALRQAVAALLAALGGGRYIFNLGHGVLPETPPENVALLADLLNGRDAG